MLHIVVVVGVLAVGLGLYLLWQEAFESFWSVPEDPWNEWDDESEGE